MPRRNNKSTGNFTRTQDGEFTNMNPTTATAELEKLAAELDAAGQTTASEHVTDALIASEQPSAAVTAPDSASVTTVSDRPTPALNGRTQFSAKSHNALVIKTENGRVKWRIIGTPDDDKFYTMAYVSHRPDGLFDISTPEKHFLIDAPMDDEKKAVFHGNIKFVRQALTSHYGRATSASVKTALTAKLAASSQALNASDSALAVMYAYGMKQPEQALSDALAAVSTETFNAAKAKLAAMMPAAVLQSIADAIAERDSASDQATADADASAAAELETDADASAPDA
jgi:hypothetical protein